MLIAHFCRYDVMTFGLVSSLAKRPGVVDVKVLQRPAASSVAVTMWERAHQLVLPQDYKDFLLVSNGRWRMSYTIPLSQKNSRQYFFAVLPPPTGPEVACQCLECIGAFECRRIGIRS
jgi:hypothetical protein